MWPTIRIRPVRRRELDEALAVPDVDRQRLLDEHVLAGLQRRLRHLVVGHRRRRQRHGVDRRVGQNGAEVAEEPDVRGTACLQLVSTGSLRVAERGQGAELVEVPNQVLAPVADADDGDADAWRVA